MKKIIIDTNALMAISELGIDLFSELENSCEFRYQLTVLRGTILELEKIVSEQRGRHKWGAKLALALLKAKKIPVLESKSHGDINVDNLLTAYSEKGYLILTQDKELKKRLTKPYLTIRQKKKVMMVG